METLSLSTVSPMYQGREKLKQNQSDIMLTSQIPISDLKLI